MTLDNWVWFEKKSSYPLLTTSATFIVHERSWEVVMPNPLNVVVFNALLMYIYTRFALGVCHTHNLDLRLIPLRRNIRRNEEYLYRIFFGKSCCHLRTSFSDMMNKTGPRQSFPGVFLTKQEPKTSRYQAGRLVTCGQTNYQTHALKQPWRSSLKRGRSYCTLSNTLEKSKKALLVSFLLSCDFAQSS